MSIQELPARSFTSVFVPVTRCAVACPTAQPPPFTQFALRHWRSNRLTPDLRVEQGRMRMREEFPHINRAKSVCGDLAPERLTHSDAMAQLR
jgi:hypothetical protein